MTTQQQSNLLNQHHWRKHKIKRWTHYRVYLCMVIVSGQPTGLCGGAEQPIPEVHRRFSNLDPDCKVPAFAPTANLDKLTEAWFKPHLWGCCLASTVQSPIYTFQTLLQVENTNAGGRWTAPEVSDSLEPELQPPLCSVPSLRCLRASGCGRPCRPLQAGRAPWLRTGRCRRKKAWPRRWRWRRITLLYCSGWKKRKSVRWQVNLGHSRSGGNFFCWRTLNIQYCYRDARWHPSSNITSHFRISVISRLSKETQLWGVSQQESQRWVIFTLPPQPFPWWWEACGPNLKNTTWASMLVM